MQLRSLATLLPFLFLIACAPLHTPVPPGAIPAAKKLSVDDEQYGHQVLQALSERYQLDYNNPRTQDVQDIVDKLTHAAHADQDPWHVYILKDDSVKNAAATRGNHVFVWTGMLQSASSDAELATVLSHEISHILAGHTDPDPNEEVKQLLINIGAIAAGVAVSAATRNPQWSGDLGRLTSSATQELGNGFLLYPYSRERELQADQIGLFIMADAKFDPQAALDFWTKLPSDPDYREGPSFLSTHPAAADRLQALKALLPQAEARYRGTVSPPAPWTMGQTGAPPSPGVTPPSGGAFGQTPSGQISSGPNDSFALNSPPTPAGGAEWIVKSDKAIVYRRPSRTSQRLGEFRRGAKVQVLKQDGEWLEIQEPGTSNAGQSAFMRSSALSPSLP